MTTAPCWRVVVCNALSHRLCIEELRPAGSPARFIQCVALSGLEPGLRVGADGRVRWMSDDPAAFVLCVSGDERLVLFKREGDAACEVSVHRSGRSVVACPGKPIVLLDRDTIDIGPMSLRVHVHGTAASVHEPRVLPPQPARWKFRTAAATLALGAVVGASAGTASGQTVATEPSPDGGGAGGAEATPDGGSESDASHDAEAGIEVREFPPVIVREPPAAGCCARNPGSA